MVHIANGPPEINDSFPLNCLEVTALCAGTENSMCHTVLADCFHTVDIFLAFISHFFFFLSLPLPIPLSFFLTLFLSHSHSLSLTLSASCLVACREEVEEGADVRACPPTERAAC